MKIPLLLGPLGDDHWQVRRSGIRWLCPDGHCCQPGEVIASCYLGLVPKAKAPSVAFPFENEYRDLKVALATPWAGVLIQEPGHSRGGFLDRQAFKLDWIADMPIGAIDGTPPQMDDTSAAGVRLRMLLLTGRRWLEPAGVSVPLLAGWHDRSRAWWWTDRVENFGHVLVIGTCEMAGIIRGDQFAYLELFDQLPGPIHVAHVPDDILVPAAAVLGSQLRRTEAERVALAADLVDTFHACLAAEGASTVPAVADWIFVGHLLKALLGCPLLEAPAVLAGRGVQTIGPPGAVILSFQSDSDMRLLRHKKLGYPIKFHTWRFHDFGPTLRRWLRTEFEPVAANLAAIKRDYLDLIDLVQAQTGAHVLVLNAVSSVAEDQTFCYAYFDRPLGKTLAGIHSKELNLLLHEIARERDISIVDVDAIAADIGQKEHFADTIHASRAFEAAVREQIVHILRERGVAGC